MLKEFQEFISRGNVMELAVGIIIGGAFTAIVTSLVEDVITPLFLTPAMTAVGAEDLAALTWGEIRYGNFLAAIISFLVIAFVVFMIVRSYNNFMKRFEKPAAEEPPAKPREEELLEEIRDLMARQVS